MHKKLRDIMNEDQDAWSPEPCGETDLDVAYTEGWEAAELMTISNEHISIESCPYPEDTPQNKSWISGFSDYCSDIFI